MYLLTYFTFLPVRSQFRPDLAPHPAALCASVQSCVRSATATELDHKSPGVREVWIIVRVRKLPAIQSLHNYLRNYA